MCGPSACWCGRSSRWVNTPPLSSALELTHLKPHVLSSSHSHSPMPHGRMAPTAPALLTRVNFLKSPQICLSVLSSIHQCILDWSMWRFVYLNSLDSFVPHFVFPLRCLTDSSFLQIWICMFISPFHCMLLQWNCSCRWRSWLISPIRMYTWRVTQVLAKAFTPTEWGEKASTAFNQRCHLKMFWKCLWGALNYPPRPDGAGNNCLLLLNCPSGTDGGVTLSA